MTKHTIAAILLSGCVALGLTTPAQAGDILAYTLSYDSDPYDYVTSVPPTTDQLIGTFSFTLAPGASATGITFSGSFGNGDGSTTALSDYYLGYTGNEEAVEIATCDSYNDSCASSSTGPTPFSVILTQAEIGDLATGLADGAIDFSYTWDSSPPAEPIPGFFPGTYDSQYVYAGAATLTISATPEPATALFCLSGLACLAASRRFRKLRISRNR